MIVQFILMKQGYMLRKKEMVRYQCHLVKGLKIKIIQEIVKYS